MKLASLECTIHGSDIHHWIGVVTARDGNSAVERSSEASLDYHVCENGPGTSTSSQKAKADPNYTGGKSPPHHAGYELNSHGIPLSVGPFTSPKWNGGSSLHPPLVWSVHSYVSQQSDWLRELSGGWKFWSFARHWLLLIATICSFWVRSLASSCFFFWKFAYIPMRTTHELKWYWGKFLFIFYDGKSSLLTVSCSGRFQIAALGIMLALQLCGPHCFLFLHNCNPLQEIILCL